MSGTTSEVLCFHRALGCHFKVYQLKQLHFACQELYVCRCSTCDLVLFLQAHDLKPYNTRQRLRSIGRISQACRKTCLIIHANEELLICGTPPFGRRVPIRWRVRATVCAREYAAALCTEVRQSQRA